MSAGYEIKEYECSKGHLIRSVARATSQEQKDRLCVHCSRETWEETTNSLLDAERLEYENKGYSRFEEFASYSRATVTHIQNLESHLKLMSPLSSDTTRFSHQEVILICKELLLLEGTNSDNIRKEYPVVIANKQYKADIAVLDDNGNVHTIVECGNLSDPLKIQLFNALYPRFIWVPYTLVPNLALMKSFKHRISEILEDCRLASQMITTVVHDVASKQWKQEMEGLSLAEILADLNELEEASNVESVIPLPSSQSNCAPSSPN